MIRPLRHGNVSLRENGLALSVRGCGNSALLRLDVNRPIDFGKVKAGETCSVKRLIMNPADISVDWEIEIEGNLRGWKITPTSGTILAEDSQPISICFECDDTMDANEIFGFTAVVKNKTANRISLKMSGSARRSYPKLLFPDGEVGVLDFGEVNTTQRSSLSFQVSNGGTGVLKCKFDVVGDTNAFSVVSGETCEIKDDGTVVVVQIVFHPPNDGPIDATLCLASNDVDRETEGELMIPVLGSGITYVLDESFQRQLDLGVCKIGQFVNGKLNFANKGPVPYPIEFSFPNLSDGFSALPQKLVIPGDEFGEVAIQWRAPGITADTVPSDADMNRILELVDAGTVQGTMQAHMPLGRVEQIEIVCQPVMPEIVLMDNMNNRLTGVDFGDTVLNQITRQVVYLKNQADFPIEFSMSFNHNAFFVEGGEFEASNVIIVKPKEIKTLTVACCPEDHIIGNSCTMNVAFMTCFESLEVPLYVRTREFCLNARRLGPIKFSKCFAGVCCPRKLVLENTSDRPVKYKVDRNRLGTHFDLQCKAFEGELGLQDSVTVLVKFNPPHQNESHTGLIVLEVDDGAESKFFIEVSGESVVPEIKISPLNIDFQTIGIGLAVSQKVEVKNCSSLEMNLACDVLMSEFFSVDPLQLLIEANGSCFVDVMFRPSDRSPQSGHLTIQGEDGVKVGGKVHLAGEGGYISLAMDKSIDFGEIDSRAVPFISRTLKLHNDGELPVDLKVRAGDGSLYEMRESAHRALLRSREKRFDNYIISLAYPKSTLLPSESMQMEIFIYVVEFAFIDTELVVELADGSAKWTCHIHAIGKPPNISQDALFLLDDLDEASKILQPHEVGRDVNFDAIVANRIVFNRSPLPIR